MAMVIPRNPANSPCHHLAVGRCSSGKNCKFSHSHLGAGEPGKPDWAHISSIECALPRRQMGRCSLGDGCIYSCSLADTHRETTAMDEDNPPPVSP